MTIDFIEDKEQEIDFQPTKTIDFQEEKPMVLQGGVSKEVELSPYEMIRLDNSLTKEQKIQKMKEVSEQIQKEIDRKHRIEMAKLYGGAALEIGSAAIPFGGVANIGGRIALRVAKPALSQIGKKVIAKNIGSGIASGLASGTMFGAGDALMNNENVVQGALNGAKEGAIGGGVLGGVAGKIATKFGRTKEVIDKVNKRNSLKHNFSEVEDQVRELIQNRRANIDSAKFDASQKINAFISQVDNIAEALGVDPKSLREVMPFIRESTDLPNENFYRLDLKDLYNRLTTEQIDVLRTVAQNHFNEMENFWQELAKVKDLKSSMSPEDYITHIWDLSDKDKKLVADYFRTKSKFEQARVIPTYKEGIEKGLNFVLNGEPIHVRLKPRTLDYAEIQKIHADQLIDATENTKFFRGIGDLISKYKNYSREIQELTKPVYDGANEIKQVKSLAEKIGEKTGNTYDFVNNFAKGCKFLFNGMHAVALTESAAAHEGLLPFRTIKTLGNLPKIIDGIKNNNYELFKQSKLAQQAIKDGVQFGAITDVNIGNFNTFLDGVSKILDKVTFGASKIITKPMKSYIDTNNKFLWNYLHNTYKLHTYDTLVKRASKNGKLDLTDNVRKDIAQLVNDTFGGQNWEGLGIKPKTLKTAQRVLLSPDWNMSATIRQSLAVFSSRSGQEFLNKIAKSSKFGAATRELSRKLGLSSFVNDVEGAGIRGEQARRYFMMFLLQTAIYSNAINACCRAIDKKNNPDKYEDGINYSSYSNNRFTEKDGIGKKAVDKLFPRPYISNDQYGREIYARIGKQALEVPEIVEDLPNSAIRKIASKSAPLINPVVTKASDELTDNWNKSGVNERYKEVFTPFTISSSKNGFRPINMFYSTSKGLNSYQARAYLKECLLKGDIDAIEKFKPKMKANKIDFDRAMRKVLKEIEQGNANQY